MSIPVASSGKGARVDDVWRSEWRFMDGTVEDCRLRFRAVYWDKRKNGLCRVPLDFGA